MEYNTLSLYIQLYLTELNPFIDKLNLFLKKHSFNKRQVEQLTNVDLITFFRDFHFGTMGDFFYSQELKFEIRPSFHIISDLHDYSKKTCKWLKFCIEFKTVDLAKDVENDDMFGSDFEYSEKAKKTVKEFARKLFENFDNSYVFFVNDYQSVFIDEYQKSKEDFSIDSDFEYAIVPNSKIGNTFIGTGETIEKGTHKILCSKEFMDNPECSNIKKSKKDRNN